MTTMEVDSDHVLKNEHVTLFLSQVKNFTKKNMPIKKRNIEYSSRGYSSRGYIQKVGE